MPTFEKIKTFISEHPTFFEAEKADIGYYAYPIEVSRSAEIDFFYPKGKKLMVKRRRTSRVAKGQVILGEKYGNPILTFAKTGSGSLYIAIKFQPEISLYEIAMAQAKTAPPANGKYKFTSIKSAAIGPVICQSKVEENEVDIAESLKITENIFVIKTSENEAFLVRIEA